MNSKKSSASPTSSSQGALKPKSTLSSLYTPLSPNASSLPSTNKKAPLTTNGATNKKISYLEDFTEEDIEKEKALKRYDALMSKLEEITEEKSAKTATASRSSSKKVLPKIAKQENTADAKVSQAAASHYSPNSKSAGQSQLKNGHMSSSDDDSDSELPQNPIKAPNELLEEVN